jgi:hypothetical protein
MRATCNILFLLLRLSTYILSTFKALFYQLFSEANREKLEGLQTLCEACSSEQNNKVVYLLKSFIQNFYFYTKIFFYLVMSNRIILQ